MGWAAVVLVLCLAAAGCDGTTRSAADAGTDAAMEEDGGPTMPLPPAAPDRPAFGDCPSGWGPVEDERGVVTCDPWPTGGPAACPVGEMQLPGEPACRRVGPACPAGPYPDDLPAKDVIYVAPGAE